MRLDLAALFRGQATFCQRQVLELKILDQVYRFILQVVEAVVRDLLEQICDLLLGNIRFVSLYDRFEVEIQSTGFSQELAFYVGAPHRAFVFG